MLTLRQREATAQRIDLCRFTPERLAGQSLADIERLPIWLGRHPLPLAELFRVEGVADDRLSIEPAGANLDGIGRAMSKGEIIVEGDAGDYCGAQLAGGRVRVSGSSGYLTGAGMQAGRLAIEADAGERVGGPMPGATRGMSGGTIWVGGHVGHRCGERMRRGQIVVAGDAADFSGANMIAGTIRIGGRCGNESGLGMRRGTLLLGSEPASMAFGYAYNGELDSPFIHLLLRQLPLNGNGQAAVDRHNGARRWLGDLSIGGQAEIVLLT